jgi:pantothenate kinase
VSTQDLALDLIARAGSARRFIVAVAGAPGSGKTTLAADLHTTLVAQGETAVVVPMDGYHLDDRVLNARGHRARKGAHFTFDAPGFVHLIKRIKLCEPDIAIPVFDRSIEMSRAAADVIEGKTRFIIVEGLYLLLTREPWADLKSLFDLSIYLDIPKAELERRLTQRILDHGHDLAYAKNWIASNDMLNAEEVMGNSAVADVVIKGTSKSVAFR